MDGILNEDLSTVEGILPFLKQCVGKGKEIPPGNILQVQQITNISFPTYDKPNYDCERHTLKITVTDGQSQGYALVPDSCPGINLHTPPGTKIKTTVPIPVQGSLFVLTRNNCEVLGGKVPKLYEKWDTQRKHAFKHEWGYTGTSVEGEGPPPWKPFGYKPTIDVAALRKMKTIDVVSDKKDGQAGTAKSQFDMQRDEAISELQATANKQKFQKPNKHLLDKEITDIMEEGFSQSEAEYAMNRFKNTQKALKFLKESKNRQDGVHKEPPKPMMDRKDRRRKGKGKDDDEEQEVPAEYQRPTKSISLFGFIEGQIKTESKTTTQTNGPAQNQGGRGRDRDLDEGIARLTMRESKSDTFGSGRGDRGRGGGVRGYRGAGRGGGDSYHSHHNTQRYDSGNQRFDTNSTRYDTSSQRYDNSGNQRYDNNTQRRDNSGSQRYENSSQRHDSSNQRFDSSSQRQDSSNQRFDNNSQRHDSSNQRYDSSSQRYDNSAQRYDNSSQRYDNSSQRYENNSQRFENRGSGKNESILKPPRFQNRGGVDSRQTDYPSTGTRNMPSGGSSYDSYSDRDRQKDSFESRTYPETAPSRPEYTGNYQSHQQRPQTGKDRPYQTEYQHQQQYTKPSDYPVPSQNYQHYQHQPSQHRQYGNTSSQNQESMGYRGGAGQQRPSQPPYPNQISGGHPASQQNASGEFTHYQYGYEGYNPAQSLVFTRSKPDNRNRGGYQGRGAASQNSIYNRDTSNRY